MKQTFLFKSLTCLIALFMASCSSKSVDANYEVIPLPQQIVASEGFPFELDQNVKIVYPKGNEKMQRNASYLADYLEKATHQKLTTEAMDDAELKAKKAIVLSLGLKDDCDEAYHLSVNSDRIEINGVTEAAVFYGIQTLRKSLPVGEETSFKFPAVEIKDYPRFGYRGVHLDVGRHFYSVDEVKTFIDMMTLHNMNKMHWHLTEDQGWRLEIKKYPKLTEVGSIRKETVIGHNSGKYDGKPYGGFYTQEEAKEIVKYAAERYITVIPEIDLPGHMQAALAAYPELGCTGGPYEVRTLWGVSDNVLCAGNPKVYQFIDDVLTEVMEIFPSEYIHIGGDECPKTQWKKCPKCQAKIRQLGLKSDKKHSKEERLQSHVINHAEKFLNKHGRQIIGWDEILEGGLAPNATVMSWRGEAGGIEAAKQKHDVIMTPNTYLYFDYYQSKDVDNEPLAIGGYLPVERVYSYEPLPKELSAEEQKHIIGIQANHWTEYMKTFSQVMYMSIPRWAALCEVQWTMPELKDYQSFLKRLPQLIAWYELEGYKNYAKHIFDVNLEFTQDKDNHAIVLTLTTIDNAPVYYTLDGSEPTEKSQRYTNSLVIDKTTTIKAVAVRPEGHSKVWSETINFSKATLKPITVNEPINKHYKFKGGVTLVDGLKGGTSHGSGRWIGFTNNNLNVTIDLEKSTEISHLDFSTCVSKGAWIFSTRGVEVKVSDDNKTFKTVLKKDFPALKQNDKDGIMNYALSFDPVKARYVNIIINPEQSLPKWHNGKGDAGWLFVDELELN